MRDVLSSALKSLSRKWLRTLLTVSGITVGVIMVVIVSLISNAGKAAVNNELDNMGRPSAALARSRKPCP